MGVGARRASWTSWCLPPGPDPGRMAPNQGPLCPPRTPLPLKDPSALRGPLYPPRWRQGTCPAAKPPGRPRPQPHLGDVMVSPQDSLEVEVLGRDQAQLQAQREQCHALRWVPALRPAPFIPLPALWFPAPAFRVLRTGRCLLGTQTIAAAATPASHTVLPQRRLALESARTGGPAGSEAAKGSGDRDASWPEAPPAAGASDAGASRSRRTWAAEGTAPGGITPAPSSPARPGCSYMRASMCPGSHTCRSGS